MAIKIENLPFYWRLKEKGSPNIVPDFRPFEFDFDEGLQMVIQKREQQTLDYLEEIYKAEYNIGYLQDINEIARPYGKDFIDFIKRVLGNWGSHVKNVLEVGCGGCTILELLAKDGYSVLGVDPSPIAVREGAKKGIRVINDVFPTLQHTQKADLIFHSDVQEHVSDPVTFLANQKKQLSEHGLIIISLPDCNESIGRGDVSMIIHQHLNYFDNESLKNTVEAAGLEVLTIETAQYGGSLYCCARNKPSNNYSSKSGKEKFVSFLKEVDNASSKVSAVFKDVLSDKNKTVGFYVPLRTLPYLSLINNFEGFRFFDDTKHWHDRAFDGTEIYIENFNDLRNNPVTDLYIMSLTFGDVIKSKVMNGIQGIETVKTLSELLESAL